jgi:hypothetical protein
LQWQSSTASSSNSSASQPFASHREFIRMLRVESRKRLSSYHDCDLPRLHRANSEQTSGFLAYFTCSSTPQNTPVNAYIFPEPSTSSSSHHLPFSGPSQLFAYSLVNFPLIASCGHLSSSPVSCESILQYCSSSKLLLRPYPFVTKAVSSWTPFLEQGLRLCVCHKAAHRLQQAASP